MISIRPTQEKDLATLAQVYVEVYSDFKVGEEWTEESAYKLMQYWYQRQPDLAFTAEVNGRIKAAFFAAIKPWWDGNHLVDGEIFVHPGCQKLGIGSHLSKRMFATAIENYRATVWDTYTFRHSDHPKDWYASLGFTENEEWMMISGNLLDALNIFKAKD